MQRDDASRADGTVRLSGPRAPSDLDDPVHGVVAVLEELGHALREAQRSLDDIDAGAATPTLAGDGAEAEENRAIRLAYARLAGRGALELRDELGRVRARAVAMAREARELRTRNRRDPSRTGGPDPASQAEADPLMGRAVAFVVTHAEEDITVEDIAAAAGVGPRRLQEVFRAQRDTTPTRFLRDVRLERARAELAATDPAENRTVAEVAARWGFAHAGRFAGLYRRAFGCHPRYTLDTPAPVRSGPTS